MVEPSEKPELYFDAFNQKIFSAADAEAEGKSPEDKMIKVSEYCNLRVNDWEESKDFFGVLVEK